MSVGQRLFPPRGVYFSLTGFSRPNSKACCSCTRDAIRLESKVTAGNESYFMIIQTMMYTKSSMVKCCTQHSSGDVSEAVMLILQIFFFEQIILQIDVSLITKGRKILKALQVLLYIVTNWCVIECDWCELIKIINECLNYFL